MKFSPTFEQDLDEIFLYNIDEKSQKDNCPEANIIFPTKKEFLISSKCEIERPKSGCLLTINNNAFSLVKSIYFSGTDEMEADGDCKKNIIEFNMVPNNVNLNCLFSEIVNTILFRHIDVGILSLLVPNDNYDVKKEKFKILTSSYRKDMTDMTDMTDIKVLCGIDSPLKKNDSLREELGLKKENIIPYLSLNNKEHIFFNGDCGFIVKRPGSHAIVLNNLYGIAAITSTTHHSKP